MSKVQLPVKENVGRQSSTSTSQLCQRVAMFALLLTLLGPLAPVRARVDEPVDTPRLYWTHGDTLAGTILAGSAKELVWSADIFADPLQVAWDALHMIRFPVTAGALDDGGGKAVAQTIETRDGNRFYGRIREASAETLVVDTMEHGEVRVRRAAISLIANPTSRAHVYSGPTGLRGWSTLTYGRKLSEWEELPGGRLTTKMVAAELYRSLPANGSMDIDVELLWRSNPSFQIRFLTPFAEPTKETVKLETRANQYVIQTLGSNGRFRQLESIGKDQTKCRFLLRWSQSAKQLSIYLGRKYLGKMNVAERQAKSGPAGIYIKNTGPQLTLSRLEVRAGSTLDITEADPEVDTILRADNTSLAGRVTDISANGVAFVGATPQPTKLPWARVSEIRFQTSDWEHPFAAEGAECVFQNGETLRGRILGADDRQVTIEVPAIEHPIACPYRKLERIVLHPKSVPPSRGSPTLSYENTLLHGQLAPTSSGEMGWLPKGVGEPVRIANRPVRVELNAILTEDAGSADDDLLYLRSGDVIPCRVQAADDEGLTLSSRFAADARIPSKEIRAVELAAPPVPPVEDFDDRWEVGEPKHVLMETNGSELTFMEPTSAHHPTILKGCDQIEFTVRRQQFEKLGSFFQVTLHGENDKERTVPFYFSGQKSFVMGTRGAAFKPIPQDHREFSVRIQTRPFAIQVNGISLSADTDTATSRNSKWLGLSFTLGQGQAPGLAGIRRFQPGQPVLTVEGFRVSRVRRPALANTTAATDTTPLLMIPRNGSRKDLAHLAVGTNNDIIRGRLLRLDANSVQWRSTQSTRVLPRDSLSGLIWLGNLPGESVAESPPTRLVLRDTTTLGLTGVRLTQDYLEGTHPLLGACRIERDAIQTLLTGSTPNRFHRHAFLNWTTMPAPQPHLTTQDEVAAELLGTQPELDLAFIDAPGRFRLSAYRGRITVLEFWASWSAPCIKNIPRVLATVQQFSPAEVSLVAVNQGEPPRVVATMLAAKDWQLTTALDPENLSAEVFAIASLPQTVVLDRQGRVAAIFADAPAELPAQLKSTIEHLLKDKP